MKSDRVSDLKSRLKERLKVCGLRPVDLAKKTGIPKSAISYYMSGRSIPRSDRIYLISQALEVSEAWLMGFDVPEPRDPEQKKNDTIISVISQLRKDPEFFNLVSMLAELPPEQYTSVKNSPDCLSEKVTAKTTRPILFCVRGINARAIRAQRKEGGSFYVESAAIKAR